jgi:hypothetical protein
LYTNAQDNPDRRRRAAALRLRDHEQQQPDKSEEIMTEVTNMSSISKGVTDLARDAAYVAVGLGVLGYQRAQVQRVELQNLLSKDNSLDHRLGGVRSELTKGITQLDELLENATQFLETSLQPLEAQLPATVTQLTAKAFEQTREVRSQIRQRVASA